MAQITPNLALTVWNNLSDPYNSYQLANNFVAIDQHDHSGDGKGLPINGATGILNGSISNAQLGTPCVATGNLQNDSVTSIKLQSNSSNDALRAVGEYHIQDLSISTEKIQDGAVTRDKIDDAVVKIPLIIHTTGGNLPSLTDSGGALYDGYQIDYTDNSSVASRNYLWRLRYNGTSWDCIGGNHYMTSSTSPITAGGNGPTIGSWYTRLGSTTFENLSLPLAGSYYVFSEVAMRIEVGNNATFGSAFYLGTTTEGAAAYSVTPISGTGTYAFNTVPATGATPLATMTHPRMLLSVSSSAASADRTLRLALGAVNKCSGVTATVSANATAVISYQSLRVIGAKGLTNFA